MSQALTFLPEPLQGEHILSTMARWAKLQGGNVENYIFKSASPHAAIFSPVYAFDAMYDCFIKQYNPTSAERMPMLQQHTLVNYYSHLMHYNRAYEIEHEAVCYRAGTKPKKAQQLEMQPRVFIPQQSKLAFADTWRWCPLCVEEDEQHCGVSYWHTAHQIPSMLCCHIHEEQQLQSECKHCGFRYTDIRQHVSPPFDGNCPQCGASMCASPCESNLHHKWLASASLQLLNQKGTITQPEYGYEMKHCLSRCFNFHGKKYAQDAIFVADRFQRMFNEWLFDNHLDVYFKDAEQAVKERVLSIDTGRIQTKRLPPISVLLWLRFFGAESLDSLSF